MFYFSVSIFRRHNDNVSPGLLDLTMEDNADKVYCLLEEGDVIDTKVKTKTNKDRLYKTLKDSQGR